MYHLSIILVQLWVVVVVFCCCCCCCCGGGGNRCQSPHDVQWSEATLLAQKATYLKSHFWEVLMTNLWVICHHS